MTEALSRREIAGAAGRIGTAGSGLAMLAALASPPRSHAQEDSRPQEVTSADATILAASYGIEARLERTYAVASRSVAGGGGVRGLLGAFRRDCRIHAERLRDAIGDLVVLPEDSEPPALERPPTAEEWLELALGFESQAYIGYRDAAGTLAARAGIELAGRLGASSAQHLALLRQALGRDPIPSAFEAGSGA